MKIWAIGDLHLSFGCKDKEMNVFGPAWADHHEKIKRDWEARVKPEDLVLIPGDISWAMHLEHALADLEWIHKLPGFKVMIKGNHDYWWHSISKVRKVLPSSIHAIYNDAFLWNDVAICGTRLWDSKEYNFDSCIDYTGPTEDTEKKEQKEEEQEKIFVRELGRLDLSMKAMHKEAKIKIAMTHYPPIGADLVDSRASKMMEEAHIQHVVFGHLHSVKKKLDFPLFGTKNGVTYHLTSCDFLDFKLLEVV